MDQIAKKSGIVVLLLILNSQYSISQDCGSIRLLDSLRHSHPELLFFAKVRTPRSIFVKGIPLKDWRILLSQEFENNNSRFIDSILCENYNSGISISKSDILESLREFSSVDRLKLKSFRESSEFISTIKRHLIKIKFFKDLDQGVLDTLIAEDINIPKYWLETQIDPKKHHLLIDALGIEGIVAYKTHEQDIIVLNNDYFFEKFRSYLTD